MHGNNPLQIPEIIRKISRYVTTNDATACARVCKAWSDHFVAAIWHTVDFTPKVKTKTLERHGHHIRVVKNIKELDHIMALISSDARLRQISIVMTATPEFYAYFSDLLRQNSTVLESMEISQPSSNTIPFFAADSLIAMPGTGTASRLSSINISGLTMTRDAFSSLLKACPALNQLDIRGTALLSTLTRKSDARCYKHAKITYLSAPIEQVFEMDDRFKNTPSLFVHFPNLKRWRTWKWTSNIDIPSNLIRDEVARCCPMLTILSTSCPTSMTINFLTQVFGDLTCITILNRQLSADLVMAILKHQETLTRIFTFKPFADFYDNGVIPEVESTAVDTDGWVIQSIPRLCPQLTSLHLLLYEMDMDDIEKSKWACHDLISLFIRVRGLNTKKKIDRAIQLWQEGRIVTVKKQGKQKMTSSNSCQWSIGIHPSDNSIEARVARHLLKFKKLREVWLGWNIRKVA
ncbi:MAG: hypothetical protein J3Q66DRAFT_321573 [Benniella sp.]|nr:MAG: hypothetical protein J3Q66DRAFT_321573 [Benniella sp.]